MQIRYLWYSLDLEFYYYDVNFPEGGVKKFVCLKYFYQSKLKYLIFPLRTLFSINELKMELCVLN
jgi:hypothetical protein